MLTLKLVFPGKAHEQMWKEIIAEVEEAKEAIIPYGLKMGLEEYGEFLEKTVDFHIGKNVPESFVPASTYFLVDDNEERIYGAVNIRHCLNAYLLERGGHVGYGVRPSERQKGYATLILKLALLKCIELGIQKVLVTCDKSNVGSAKTIVKNGGILENEITDERGIAVQRYYIQL